MNDIKLIQPKPQDYRFGAEEEIIKEDGNWTDYIPLKEYQHFNWGDTMSCVSFSALNVIETLLRFKYNINTDYSDRFTAKMSGTTHNGNSMTAVADSIRNDGLVPENKYPDTADSWEDFYKEILDNIKELGKSFVDIFNIEYGWVIPSSLADRLMNLTEALKRSPIQIIVHAWDESKKEGEVYQRTDKQPNHAVMLYNETPDYWEIYDHYEDVTKKLAKDFKINFAMKFKINQKMENINLPNNNIVFNCDTGEYGLVSNGIIRVAKNKDEIVEILAAKLNDKTYHNEEWKKFKKEPLHKG